MDLRTLLENSDWLRELARGLMSQDHDADDVVQDTFVAALEQGAHEGALPVTSPRPWLRTVLRNFANGCFRRRSRQLRREERAALPEARFDPDNDIDEDIDEDIERLEMIRLLMDEVLALDSTDREVIVCRYFRGMTSAEIAVSLRVSSSAVRMRLMRALGKLRTRLDEVHDGDRGGWIAIVAPFSTMPVTAAAATGASLTKVAGWLLAVFLAGSLGAWTIGSPTGRSSDDLAIVPVHSVDDDAIDRRLDAISREMQETRAMLTAQHEEIRTLLQDFDPGAYHGPA